MIDIHEARNLPAGDYYVEIKADETLLALTSTKRMAPGQTPFWGENFNF